MHHKGCAMLTLIHYFKVSLLNHLFLHLLHRVLLAMPYALPLAMPTPLAIPSPLPRHLRPPPHRQPPIIMHLKHQKCFTHVNLLTIIPSKHDLLNQIIAPIPSSSMINFIPHCLHPHQHHLQLMVQEDDSLTPSLFPVKLNCFIQFLHAVWATLIITFLHVRHCESYPFTP